VTPDDIQGIALNDGTTIPQLGFGTLNVQPDLFLMHWPVPTLYDGDYVSTGKAVAELVNAGRLRTAGVSNFQPAHLDRAVRGYPLGRIMDTARNLATLEPCDGASAVVAPQCPGAACVAARLAAPTSPNPAASWFRAG